MKVEDMKALGGKPLVSERLFESSGPKALPQQSFMSSVFMVKVFVISS
jgi:hypothetical protein